MIENQVIKSEPTSYTAYQWAQLNCKPVKLPSMDEIIRISAEITKGGK